MELTIKISDEAYRKWYNTGKMDKSVINDAMENAIKLPKGHGDLIDADAFLKENKDYTGWILCSDAWGGENAYKDTLEDLINEAPKIIEADRR